MHRKTFVHILTDAKTAVIIYRGDKTSILPSKSRDGGFEVFLKCCAFKPHQFVNLSRADPFVLSAKAGPMR